MLKCSILGGYGFKGKGGHSFPLFLPKGFFEESSKERVTARNAELFYVASTASLPAGRQGLRRPTQFS